VIEQTIREKLPKGFQRSEYLYDHGMVDMVVHRHNLRSTIGSLVGILTKGPAPVELSANSPARAIAQTAPAAQGDDDLVTAPPEAAHAE
jgi:acetyl-CoA carboxylase carboxyl transferase subunit beta